MTKHPYDLSGGEQQLAAFAKVMAADPKILLLDEPTKGLDAAAKQNIIAILRRLKAEGVTVVIVTHDVEFASSCADRCARFWRKGGHNGDYTPIFRGKQLLHDSSLPHDKGIF